MNEWETNEIHLHISHIAKHTHTHTSNNNDDDNDNGDIKSTVSYQIMEIGVCFNDTNVYLELSSQKHIRTPLSYQIAYIVFTHVSCTISIKQTHYK